MATKKTPPAVPWLSVAPLCLVDGAHYFAICSLFSYAGIMSADLGWAADRDQAGFVAGFLASAGLIGRMFTSSLWGCGVARYGYKAALSLTLLSLMLGGIGFGLSSSLPSSMAVRFLFFGVGNGWVGMMAPMVMEVAGAERQTEVLGIVMGSGSFTQLFGPALGGWTYGLVSDFPALVPSLIGAAYALVALLTTTLWVPSTLGIYAAVPETAADGDSCGTPSKSRQRRRSFHSCRLLCVWPMPVVIAMRMLQGAMTMGFMELTPLWLISTRPLGGLELSEEEVGTFLARSAVWNIVYFAVVMPYLSKRLGVRRSAMLLSGAAGTCCVALPWTSTVLAANVLHMLGTAMSISMGALAKVCTNNSVDPANRSTLQGHVMIFETLAKAFGPIFVANAFAWTLSEWGSAGRAAVFLCLGAFHLLSSLCAACLPASVDLAPEQRAEGIGEQAPLPRLVGASADAEGAPAREDAEAGDNLRLLQGGKAPLPQRVGASADAEGAPAREDGEAGDHLRLLQWGKVATLPAAASVSTTDSESAVAAGDLQAEPEGNVQSGRCADGRRPPPLQADDSAL